MVQKKRKKPKVKRKVLKFAKTRRAKPKKPRVKRTKPKKLTAKIVKKEEPEDQIRKTKIRIIGIGGGGSSIVSEIAPRLKKMDFFVANTDLKALRESAKKAKRFQFGQSLTKGLGTGMNVELGKIAAQEEKEKIKKLLKGQDICILVASLGGGTGSGAVPVFAKISKNLGNLTYGILTLPFKFEGEKKMEIARESLKRLKPNLNAITVIPNERIFQIINKDTPLKQALSAINKKLAESLEGLIEMIYLPGLINIDFADLRTILEGRGRLTYLNTVEIQGANRVDQAIRKVISNPLYPYSIRGAKGILFNIAGEKNLGLADVSQISKSIAESVNKEAKIIFGISQSKKYQDKIKITLLATGCGFRSTSRLPTKGGSRKIFPKKPKKPSISPKPRLKRPKKVKPIRKVAIQQEKPKMKAKPEKNGAPKPEKKQAKKIKISKTPKPELKPKKDEVETQKPVSEAPAIPPNTEESERFLGTTPQPSSEDNTSSEANPTTKDFSEGVKIRRNALQIKKETEEAEKELLAKEKAWETPAFLRKKKRT